MEGGAGAGENDTDVAVDGGAFASTVAFGGMSGLQGVGATGRLSHFFGAPLVRATKSASATAGGGAAGGATDANGVLQNLVQSLGSGPGQPVGQLIQSMSSGLSFLLGGGEDSGAAAAAAPPGARRGGGGAVHPFVAEPTRPVLGDTIAIVKAADPRHGQLAKVVQDDRDAQPYRLLHLKDKTLSDIFYRTRDVELRARGHRPFVGDRVVILKEGDPRKGEAATVIKDDADQQPYRLRFADGLLSQVYYRMEEVDLDASLKAARAAMVGSAAAGSAAAGSTAAGSAAAGSAAAGSAAAAAGTSAGGAAAAAAAGAAEDAHTAPSAAERGPAQGASGALDGDGRREADGFLAEAPYHPFAWLRREMLRRERAVAAPRTLRDSMVAEMARHEAARGEAP